MRTLRVIAPLTLTSGVIGLTASQADARAHLIRATKKKGQFEIVHSVGFKIGEQIDLPEALEKGAAACLAEPGATRSLAQAERAAELERAQSAAAIARGEAEAAAAAVRAEFAGQVSGVKAALDAVEAAGEDAAAAEAAIATLKERIRAL